MRIGLLVPDLRDPGGIAEEALLVARSLHRGLGADVRLISLAMSSADSSSLLLRRPRTWKRHPAGSYAHAEFAVEHFGAPAADIELARYCQRRPLLERVA